MQPVGGCFEFQDFQVTKKLKSVVDDELINDAEEDEFVDIDYLFGYVCALCHDGGDLLWYILFFHPTFMFIMASPDVFQSFSIFYDKWYDAIYILIQL